MAKSPPKPAALGKQPKKKIVAGAAKPSAHAGPTLPAAIALSLEERTELKQLFASEVFRKAFHNARLMKPSVTPPGLSTALGGQIALVQLCRIQGWKMFEAALAVQVTDKLPKPEPLQETYADPDFAPLK